MAKTYVIIGMPGSGKSTIGRRLAARLNLPFTDSDTEIEAAAGMTVSQIFERLGEPEFRMGERRVIARLMAGPQMVLATGGGAFMNDQTRELIKKEAISIWLKADFEVLMERCARSDDRPLLKKGDPATILRGLMQAREPVYALADITVATQEQPIDMTVDQVIAAIRAFEATQD